jgi:hypothetical protein
MTLTDLKRRPGSKAKRGRRTRKKEAAAPGSSATVLILRTCDANMRSHGGFTWPTSGPVKCDDWKPVKACGNGLHGFLWGEGDGSLASFAEDAKWLVVEAASSEVVNLDGKVKFPSGVVVFCGSAFDATKYIAERAPNTVRAIIRGTSTSGYRGTSTSGDGGEIRIKWWDDKTHRYRTAVGYVGEDGLLAGVAYCCREGKFHRKDGK